MTISLRRKDPAPMPGREFACERCGACCTGDGFVNVSPEECRRIAGYLGIPLGDFLARYTRQEAGHDRWLADSEGNDLPCVFLRRPVGEPAACAIEPVKPGQCAGFPKTWTRSDAPEWCAGLKTLDAVATEE